MLRDEISQALTTAMKARKPRETSTLRLILAAIKDRDIASRTGGAGGSIDGIGDDEVMKVLQTMIRQRKDSMQAYTQGGRPELADQEAAEIEVIRRFLPAEMSDAELAAAVDGAVEQLGATGLKDMGRTMAHLRETYAGRMDFSKASARLKQRLAS